VNGKIFNSKGVHVGVVTGDAVFGLNGQKLYDLKGSNIYKLNGDLVGHFSEVSLQESALLIFIFSRFSGCADPSVPQMADLSSHSSVRSTSG
jgi:hypothetical protein